MKKEIEKSNEEKFLELSKIPHTNKKHKLTIGQKTADSLTKWAGSWIFILLFLIFIIIWIWINSLYLFEYSSGKSFDPYPFILLNLILSCLAAIQAPIILMSQIREAQRDRIRAEYDYQVDKKAEKEIREIRMQLDKIEKNLRK